MNPAPDWNFYRTFLAVAQEGSLSGAARRLGLTQPTVARHVDALEAAIGAELFLRSQRGLVPTEMALDLMPYAETLASTAAALMRVASGAAGEVRGTVRISASEVVGVERLPPILAGLRRRHPGLVVELVLSNVVDDLLRREADVAVRMIDPTQEALVAKRLPSIELGLHARRDYLDRRGLPASIACLADHDLIGFDRETPVLRAHVQNFPAFDRPAFAAGRQRPGAARRDPRRLRHRNLPGIGRPPRPRPGARAAGRGLHRPRPLDRHARGPEDQRAVPGSVRWAGGRVGLVRSCCRVIPAGPANEPPCSGKAKRQPSDEV